MNTTKKSIIEIDYNDLEAEVKKTWGHTWEFVADQECINDSQHSFTIDGKIDEYNLSQLERFVKTGQGIFLKNKLRLLKWLKCFKNKVVTQSSLVLMKTVWK